MNINIKNQTPDPVQRKAKGVQGMFDRIAPTYDFLNHFLSLNIDKNWRKKAVRHFENGQFEYILDIASGTGDFALESLKAASPKNCKCTVVGIDFSYNMLKHGSKSGKKKFKEHSLNYNAVQGDAQELPFPDRTFTGLTIAFGIRNVERIDLALKEARRVLKPGGRFLILEFSEPNNILFRKFYQLYFHHLFPRIGNLISKDKGAYSYLPKSVSNFPKQDEFKDLLIKAGFDKVDYKDFSMGISTLYIADVSK